MKGIYLAAYRASHPGYNIDYQDINGLRDIGGDMLEIDLSPYDFIIATPPCNFWSRANYRRYVSEYALKTMHLLPLILKKLCAQKSHSSWRMSEMIECSRSLNSMRKNATSIKLEDILIGLILNLIQISNSDKTSIMEATSLRKMSKTKIKIIDKVEKMSIEL